MDVTDVEGDKAAGVLTIPVLLGQEVAIGLALVLLTAGVATAAAGALSGECYLLYLVVTVVVVVFSRLCLLPCFVAMSAVTG